MATEGEKAAESSSNFDEEIKKLTGKGKVHMVCCEFLDAVKCFEEATKKLDLKYGEADDHCGEAYFYYGKSLLEVARMEGGVLGNALQGAIESNSQENGTKGENHEEEKCEEEKKETTDTMSDETPKENQPDNEKVNEKDIFVNDEVDESEKEKISADVLDAMTEGGMKEAPEENISTTEDKSQKEITSEETNDGNKTETTSEGKDENKSDKPSEVTNEMVGDERKPDGKEVKDEKGETAKEERKDEDEGQVTEATKENQQEITESKGENEEEGEENDENNEEEDEENMETEEGDENSEEVEDEPTYMELAWQMLEMARIIFSKREHKEGKLLLGQCHLKLGEIQMEQEQFLSAIEDFLKCLDIQKELLSPDDRLLAETAYNIGLAFSFQSMYDKSKDYFSQALETIGLRIKSLEESIKEAESKSKGKDKATPDNPLVANTKELKELQELYPEIKLKVDDAEEMMKQANDKPSISSVMGKDSTTTIGFGDSSSCCKEQHTNLIATKKPSAATDISHLVHRNKRKPEEADEADSVAKKPRQDTEDAETKEKSVETTNNNGQPATMET